MNRNHLASLAVLALAAAPLLAQEGAAPAPAKELDKLKVLAGHWHGSGTAVMQPGAPASDWTCESTYEWVLGNFWLQCDTTIKFADMPQPLRFREYMGWDNESQRYVNVGVNNMGEGVLAPVILTGDDTMVSVISMVRGGKPQTERAITKYGKDEMSFGVTFLGVEGPAAETIQGTLKRVAKTSPTAIDACHALAPADPAMAKIARTVGDFDLVGQMVMMPGTPAMPVTGRDSLRTLFDGAIVQVTTTGVAEGMPGSYEAHSFYYWNAADSCYGLLMVSNMGEVGEMHARFVGDDKLVTTYAGTMMGAPMVNRTVLELDAKGKPKGVVSHSCVGASDPFVAFRGDYKPAK